MSRTRTATVEIEGARETLARLNALPKEINDGIKDKAGELADVLAGAARSAGRSSRVPQAKLVAGTVKVARDRLPSVKVGGTKKLGRKRAPAYKLLFASEFGMNKRSGWYAREAYSGSSGRQYRAHLGQQGRWFFPAVEQHSAEVAEAWEGMVSAALDDFEKGE